MTDKHDNPTPDRPLNWDRYARLLRRLPHREIPEGFTARLNARVSAERQRKPSLFVWVMTPAVSLAAVLAIVWMGTMMPHQNAPTPARVKSVAMVPSKGPRSTRPAAAKRLPDVAMTTATDASPAPAPASLADSISPPRIASRMVSTESAVTGRADRQDAEDAGAKEGNSAIAFFPGGSIPMPSQ